MEVIPLEVITRLGNLEESSKSHGQTPNLIEEVEKNRSRLGLKKVHVLNEFQNLVLSILACALFIFLSL